MVSWFVMVIVRRLIRQHRSVVLVIPKLFCRDLGLVAGDYVEVQADRRRRVVVARKIALGGAKDVGSA
jgi:antitoxin component of MazEF toxin-antitoxin module